MENTTSAPELSIIFIVLFINIIPIILHFRQEKVILKHQTLQKMKKVPFLYSWSSVVFGFFVPLLRGDFKWFFIYLIVGLFTYNIGSIILAFFYNKSYITSLIEKGYLPADERSKELLVSKGIISQ